MHRNLVARGVAPVLLAAVLTSCSTSTAWRHAALGAAAADLGTSEALMRQGGVEANPVLGRGGSKKFMLVNAAIFATIWLVSKDWPEASQMRLWKTLTFVRLMPVAWNTAQLVRGDGTGGTGASAARATAAPAPTR